MAYSDCRLTAELFHEANVPMGIEGQRVGCDAQGVEKVGGSDALQGLETLCTHRPHLLLGQTAVPERQNISQGHVLLRTQNITVSNSLLQPEFTQMQKKKKKRIRKALKLHKKTKRAFVENKPGGINCMEKKNPYIFLVATASHNYTQHTFGAKECRHTPTRSHTPSSVIHY